MMRLILPLTWKFVLEIPILSSDVATTLTTCSPGSNPRPVNSYENSPNSSDVVKTVF